jgi:short-subunit dehydrogenase
MSKIFITGSSDGIGLETAKQLINLGHKVTLHARDEKKAKELESKLDTKTLIADLNSLEETKKLTQEINNLDRFDTIIHNAGVFHEDKKTIFRVNVLAPYILTALIKKPKQLIYIGSNMHPQGEFDLEKLSLEKELDYSSSKLLILMMSLAISRYWKDVCVNTIDPGWVKTKMANYNAPDSLEDGSATQVWLASNNNLDFSGKYFYHLKETIYSSKADDIKKQDKLINIYEELTGIKFPHKN